jgi:hypothetical protein
MAEFSHNWTGHLLLFNAPAGRAALPFWAAIGLGAVAVTAGLGLKVRSTRRQRPRQAAPTASGAVR